MSIAGQIAGMSQRVIGITLARMMKRRQFGHTLFEHQALRLRMADLQARVDLLRYGLAGIAAQGRLDLRAAAAVKVTAARLGRRGARRVHAHLRRLGLSGRRDPAGPVVARHEAGPRRRRHRRGAVGVGGRGDETRLRRLRRDDRLPRQRVERHPAVRHVVLAEEVAAGVFAQPTGTAIAVIGVEHDSPATGFDLEDAGDDARQQDAARSRG